MTKAEKNLTLREYIERGIDLIASGEIQWHRYSLFATAEGKPWTKRNVKGACILGAADLAEARAAGISMSAASHRRRTWTSENPKYNDFFNAITRDNDGAHDFARAVSQVRLMMSSEHYTTLVERRPRGRR